MKGDSKVIEHLNAILKNELTVINQYFLHARILKDWGLIKLGEKEYQESLEEMRHADELIERILFLEGLPNLQDLGKLYIGENVEEILKCDRKMELIAIPMLREAIKCCEEKTDYISRDLLMKILSDEEAHLDFLDTELGLIARIGIENYQQSQMA
ncbi:bacterioferritin [Piscirickettsia salmonis]|uniref:Bacterioferritin n=1 Tax=Piscirickettsia salmonis TaxID=1238 RepID=A0A9Q6LUG3_PISSA|nr:bacterioferritin [Piscirickettsia salmonis]RNC77436.1 bacterioferritin [Piscirickettsiaceae bacterium NZ-RLO2]ALA24840.1 bacterioferritin [Piscirickettsia salmonis]APS45160.1 bacterioferritin [Piscirickettsia salmonis]APS48520.1 bacterioferritin [Piscirickettsia salmonis]APS49780.1 bacterioferritin [Piscirickettsia salmonis]